MATLTSQQLKDSYQSLVTIGDSITSDPTSGQLENGKGTPLTAVGIGTDDPDGTLHVETTAISGGEQIAKFTVSDDSTSYLKIANGTGSNNTFNPSIQTLSSGTNTSRSDIVTITTDTGSTPAYVIDSRLAGGALTSRPILDVRSYGNSKMLIDASGNVGIGTTSPNSNYKTHIEAGSGNNTGLLVTTTDNADIAQVIIAHDEGSQGGLGLVSDKTNNIAKIRVTNSAQFPLAFEVRGSDGTNERMRILPTGGITFNGDTATANALDDYEEGTFDPIIFGSTTAGTPTYSHTSGNYTKIGDLVHFNLNLVVTDWTGSPAGEVRVGDFAFCG